MMQAAGWSVARYLQDRSAQTQTVIPVIKYGCILIWVIPNTHARVNARVHARTHTRTHNHHLATGQLSLSHHPLSDSTYFVVMLRICCNIDVLSSSDIWCGDTGDASLSSTVPWPSCDVSLTSPVTAGSQLGVSAACTCFLSWLDGSSLMKLSSVSSDLKQTEQYFPSSPR